MRNLALLLLVSWPVCAQLESGPNQPPAARIELDEWSVSFARLRALAERGEYAAADGVAQQALREAARFGPNDVRVGLTLNQTGLVSQFLGRYTGAERAYRRAIRILEADASHALALVQTLHNLASLCMQFGGRYEQAERLMRRAVELATARFGSAHPETGPVLANLASAMMMQGKFREAAAVFHRALAVLEAGSSPYRANTASVLSNLGYLAFVEGDPRRAFDYVTRSLQLYETALGRAHPEMITPLLNLGRVCLVLNRTTAAEEPLRRAAALALSSFGPDHPILAEILSTHAEALGKQGRKKEARNMEAASRTIRELDTHRLGNMTVDLSDLIDSSRK
jgi:tetratricopeptide (TPR) repeat protein